MRFPRGNLRGCSRRIAFRGEDLRLIERHALRFELSNQVVEFLAVDQELLDRLELDVDLVELLLDPGVL